MIQEAEITFGSHTLTIKFPQVFLNQKYFVPLTKGYWKIFCQDQNNPPQVKLRTHGTLEPLEFSIKNKLSLIYNIPDCEQICVLISVNKFEKLYFYEDLDILFNYNRKSCT